MQTFHIDVCTVFTHAKVKLEIANKRNTVIRSPQPGQILQQESCQL